MKRQLLLLLVTVSVIDFSCKKIDFPLPKKLCQIKKITRGGPGAELTLEYTYNHQRQLIQLNYALNNAAFHLYFEYDDHGQLMTMYEEASVKNRLIYNNGLVIRIDRINSNDQLFHQIFFTYDHLNRLVERNGENFSIFRLARYEYEGRSRNPKRKLLYSVPFSDSNAKALHHAIGRLDIQEPQLILVYEYKYDNKINPQLTLIGQPLSPFYFGNDLPVDFFEPITENNIVHQKLMGVTGDTLFTYQENFTSYEYKNLYPIKENHHRIFTNPNPIVPRWETFETATYEYECKN